MKNEIIIEDDIIKYFSKEYSSNYDTSWILSIKSILIIGAIIRMQGDDDSLFLVFIDSEEKEYYINTSKNINGFKDFIILLEKDFNVNFNELNNQLYFKSKVIYPKNLMGEKLFEHNFSALIKRLLGLKHIASGKINSSIIKRVRNKNYE